MKLERFITTRIRENLAKQYSTLLLGPRQVGKTTLITDVLLDQPDVKTYLLQDPTVRLDLERDPGKLIRQIEAQNGTPIVFVDEAQKVPDVFNSAQVLLDANKAVFILSRSSARKLRRANINLLPGRILAMHLEPLSWGELGFIQNPTIQNLQTPNINTDITYSFETMLMFGSLPKIIHLPASDRAAFLQSYSQIYLEEEIRQEALTRNIGAFSHFLQLAALESGTAPNLTRLSQESGVSQPAIKGYYQLLEDTLVIKTIPPFLKRARKRILSSPRYYFFDCGVRNALSHIPLVPESLPSQMGTLFEHAVILEILRRISILNLNYQVYYWRTHAGAEVDCIIDTGTTVIPVEIKSSRTVTRSELKSLKIFLEDYKDIAPHGYVITTAQQPEKIADNITLLPWSYL